MKKNTLGFIAVIIALLAVAGPSNMPDVVKWALFAIAAVFAIVDFALKWKKNILLF